MRLLSRLRTYARLGPMNLVRVGIYKVGMRVGLHPALSVRAEVARAPFFGVATKIDGLPQPNAGWDGALVRFGWHREPVSGFPPAWFANPFSDRPQPDASRDWWRIPDFEAGDIKGLWELSRFDWVVAWATKAAHGDAAAMERLNTWLNDWASENPPYRGPNWKCGQEASIRVMHLAVAAWILGQDRSALPGFVDLLVAHLKRIEPTMSYAVGQQNNHATSEAAALFIGGSLLGDADSRARRWMSTGRRRLEERARTLVAPDGSFSQYSTTYHRLMLDTYALAEAWRRHRDLPAFSDGLMERLAAATRWLEALVDRDIGDAPNIGANDGARLLQLTDCDYRDFRPSLQLAAALFLRRDVFGEGDWNRQLRWLGVAGGVAGPVPSSVSFDEGGYHVLRNGRALAVLRYPRFAFRPSQCDVLHLDLWHAGRNLLRDAGTFSYNDEAAEWFASSTAHNTVSFDGRDQMPRIGRFLLANWPKAESVAAVRTDGETVSGGAAYTDDHGARHHRQVILETARLTCTDTISGLFRRACLRWRLAPIDWVMDGKTLRGDGVSVEIAIDGVLVCPELGMTRESRYYRQCTDAPSLSVLLNQPCTIVTRVVF